VSAVCFYISGHGFGHASRQIEIVNAVGAASPHTSILIRTSAPQWLFDRTLTVPVQLLPGECDTGVVQRDSLRLDASETIARAWAFHSTLAERARREATLLREHGVRLVVVDAPPLGCAAAHAAGVPALVAANFTWDWIYEHYPEVADAPELVPRLRDAYAKAAGAWRMPLHGGFETVPAVEDVPFVARHARHARADVRRLCSLPADLPLALVSFGGYGVDGLDLARVDALDHWGIVITHARPAAAVPPAGVFEVPESLLYGSGLRYEDLVAAVEVVMTKPGYGIVSECVANRTAMLYTSRGHFIEYDVMVREMPRYLRCRYIEHDELFRGRWRDGLDAVLASPAPDAVRTDGADEIARKILEGTGD